MIAIYPMKCLGRDHFFLYVHILCQCLQPMQTIYFKIFERSPPPPGQKKMGFPLTGHSTVFLCAPDKIIKNIFVLDCFDEQAKRVLAKVAL